MTLYMMTMRTQADAIVISRIDGPMRAFSGLVGSTVIGAEHEKMSAFVDGANRVTAPSGCTAVCCSTPPRAVAISTRTDHDSLTARRMC